MQSFQQNIWISYYVNVFVDDTSDVKNAALFVLRTRLSNMSYIGILQFYAIIIYQLTV